MKRIINNSKSFLLTFTLTFITLIIKAQDKKLNVDINVGKESSQWYMNPVVWVIGGAVFILLLVALLRKK